MSTENEGHGAPEDIKEKFREALEHKKHQQHPHAEGGHGDSKAHGAHGPEGAKREFRRKSV